MSGGLALSLSNALTGLNVNQQALAVLSQNIANANTAGYSKQTVSQQSIYLDGQGQGVSIQDITRKVDDYLTSAVQNQNSVVGQTGVLDDYNARLQLLLGNPGSANSIDSYVNSFFNSLQSLATTPQNSTLQKTAINSGVTLASQVSQLAKGIQGLQFQADQDISAAITAINTDLRGIFSLNTTISDNAAVGKSVSELQDKRDGYVKDLAQYVNVHTFVRSNGSISLTTGNGVSILDDSLYQLSYTPAGSVDAFANNSIMSAITVSRFDPAGKVVGAPTPLTTSAPAPQVVSTFTSGKMAALLDMRDHYLPDLNTQLDNMAATLRDQINAVHNAGSGFPGAAGLTGTRAVNGQDGLQWTGSVRIALLNADGQPIQSPYSDEPYGLAPLTLDLSTLNTGNGSGKPTVQGVIDAINSYYTPRSKVEVGNLNNIELVSDSTVLPNNANQFKFDFDLSNLSGTSSNFYLTNVQVKDNVGADLGAPTSTIPTITLDSTNTYTTSSGSADVIVKTTGTNNLIDGQIVYLSTPPSAVNGIPAASLGGYFVVSNVTSGSFQITATNQAASSGAASVAGQTALPPYQDVDAGSTARTVGNGTITANLASNPTAPYYTITATVGVDDGTGNIKTSQITYRINNQQNAILNTHFGALQANGDGTVVTPSVSRPLLTATLVDAQGKELSKVNGQYTSLEDGYLKIQAANSSYFVSIDSLDSKEIGKPDTSPPTPGTNRGFSHYFDLNDFFVSNDPNSTGDAVAGSAINMAVSQRLQNDPTLLSTGKLTQSSQPVGAGATPNYTYELNTGDNSFAQQLAGLGLSAANFAAAGGLGATAQTFSAYAGLIIGVASTNASTAKTDSTNAQTLMDGFTQRASSISGVNLDNELANTVIYQNAYAASARVITVASQLFETLLQSFG